MPKKAAQTIPAEHAAPDGGEAVNEAPAAAASSGAVKRDPGDLVPGWLAITVLLLLLAVATLGGYVVRGMLVDDGGATTAAEVAVAEWQRRVEAEPDDPDSLIGLGYAYQQEGRYEDAYAAYQDALAIDPNNTGALYNSGIVLLELGRDKEAEVAFWDVLELVPDHALAAKSLGELYVGKQQYKSALVALEPVIEVRPQFADLQYLAGYACEQLGLTAQAVEYYRGALTYAPDFLDARDGLRRLGEEG